MTAGFIASMDRSPLHAAPKWTAVVIGSLKKSLVNGENRLRTAMHTADEVPISTHRTYPAPERIRLQGSQLSSA
jgi:hypothetical protein